MLFLLLNVILRLHDMQLEHTGKSAFKKYTFRKTDTQKHV